MTPASKGITFTINADDRTAATFARVLQGADKFGKNLEKGFGSTMKRAFAPTNLLSTLNLLKMAGSAVSGVFNSVAESVEEGARAQLAIKSFASVVSMSERHATGLARQLQEAAMNTMDLQGAMQMANRSMLAGLSFDQMKQITAFATRKSSTMGISTQSAVERIVMGLSRGSPQILDDFALLVDGIDQVKRGYNAIHGAKAFDSLGPAAQKSQIIEAAMKDMSVQMGRLGISGNESLVRFDGMRTAMADIVTDIKRAVATSPKLAGMAKSLTDQFVQARTFISDNFESIAGLIDRSLGGTVKSLGTMLSSGPIGMLFKSFDFKNLMPSLTGLIAKVPLFLSDIALRIQRVFLGIGASIAGGISSIIDALTGPLGSIVEKIGGGADEAFIFKQSMMNASTAAQKMAIDFKGGMKDVDKQLKTIAQDMKDIDKLAGQLGKGGGMAALAQQAAAGLLNVRAAFAGVAASAREAFDPIGKRLGEIKAKSDEAAKGIGDRLKKAMEAVKEKANEAGAAMKSAEEKMLDLRKAWRGEETSNAERRLSIMLARENDPRAKNRLKFQFANWIGQRAGAMHDPEEALGLQRRRMEILQGLAEDPAIFRNKAARMMVDRELIGDIEAVGKRRKGVDRIRGREDQANRFRHDRDDLVRGIGEPENVFRARKRHNLLDPAKIGGERVMFGLHGKMAGRAEEEMQVARNDREAALAEQARLGHQLNAQAFNDGALKPLKASFDGLKRTVQELGGAIKVVVRNAGAVGEAANPGGGALGRFAAGIRQGILAADAGGG